MFPITEICCRKGDSQISYPIFNNMLIKLYTVNIYYVIKSMSRLVPLKLTDQYR